MNLHLIIYFSLSLRDLNKENNETLTFRVKKREEKLKILGSKPSQGIEKTMPFKSLFDLSRYLDRLPRYKGSKCP